MVNAALAAFLLLLLAPIGSAFDGKPGYVQVAVVLLSAPFLLLAAVCLVAAVRPGALGRVARRLRGRRAATRVRGRRSGGN